MIVGSTENLPQFNHPFNRARIDGIGVHLSAIKPNEQ